MITLVFASWRVGLLVLAFALPATPTVQDRGSSRQVNGMLHAGSLRTSTGAPFNAWSFTATAGNRIVISVTAHAFKPLLQVGLVTPSGGVNLLQADGTRDRQDFYEIGIVARVTGEHLIRVTTQDVGGMYLLTVSGNTPSGSGWAGLVQRERPRPLELGRDVADRLENGERTDSSGRRYQDWAYQGTRGERLRVLMQTTFFASRLSIGRLEGGGWKELAAAGNREGDIAVTLDVTLPADGVFVVRASSLRPRQTGVYSLLVERRREP